MANIITGDQDDNHLFGTWGDDILRGLGGNDTLFGGEGDDVLEGGAGNDVLDGGAGDNTYLFGRGDGQDLIQSANHDPSQHDMIRFGEDIAPGDIIVERVGERLELRIRGTSDSISVDYYFMRGWARDGAAHPHGVEEFRFADGASWNRETILTMLRPVVELDYTDNFVYGGSFDGKGGNDFLAGSWDDDVLRGGDGNDTLFGESGDDFLDGGAGDDRLDAGQGNNTIRFSRGGGQDTLNFGSAWDGSNLISLGDALAGTVALARSDFGQGYDLVISYRDTGDALTVSGFFDPNLSYVAEGVRIQFADRTILTASQIKDEVMMNYPGTKQVGTEFGDYLDGGWGNDTIEGGAGGDQLRGHFGNDILKGEDGDDQLSGDDGNDMLDGGAGVDSLHGGMGNDVLIGGDGFDELFGDMGDDILDAGAGDAHLNAGEGNNMILFGRSAGEYRVMPAMPQSLNTIVLAADVRPADIMVLNLANYWELTIVIKETQARLILPLIPDWQNGGYEPTQSYTQLKFADGTVWDNDMLMRARYTGDDSANYINGTNGDDWMDGRGGDDHVDGMGGNDTVRGGAGNDMLFGGQGNDLLIGGDGNDHLFGDDGDDVLNGGAGDDRMMGGSGTNVYQIDMNGGRDIVDVWGWGPTSNILQFGAGIDPDNILVRVDQYSGDLVVMLNDGMDQVTVLGPRGANGLPDTLSEMRFANGVVWTAEDILRATTSGNSGDNFMFGTEANDVMDGKGGNDQLHGMGGDDLMIGGAGDDRLMGGPGNNTYEGGTGNDVFDSDLGADTYLFNIGDGHDTINEYSFGWGSQQGVEYQSQPNTIRFGEGIAPGDLRFEMSGNMLTIFYGANNSIQIPYSDISGPVDVLPVDRFEFADNSVWTYRQLTNHAPELMAPIGEVYATEGKPMQYDMPSWTFFDQDAEALTYRLEREDGGALPSWLQFNPLTGKIAGTPGYADSGELMLKITAVDRAGASASDVFRLKVDNTDQAPELRHPVATQYATETGMFSATLPADTFVDPEGGDMTFHLSVPGGSLPTWLHFDGATLTMHGIPGDADTGTLALRLTAWDFAGNTTSVDYTLEIANINQAPVLSQVPSNQSAVEASAFDLRIPDAFFDRDAGDVLSYSLALADGPLPGWLQFNAASMTISGTAGHADTGVLNLRLTATDSGGLATSTAFTLTVADVNQTPVLLQSVAPQFAVEASGFSLTVPVDAFADADGDALSFSMLNLGGPLPAWLQFDAATMTLSGTPGDLDTGILRLQLRATDSSGMHAAAEFSLEVRDINQAPVLVQLPANQSVEDNVAFSYVLPENMFSDADANDSGTLSVEGMPSWLSFDAQTRSFSGTPALANVGPLALTVVYTDAGGLSASAGLVVNVTPAASMTLTGGAGADTLTGKSNSDVLIGLGGDDILDGGIGADRLEGGNGNDTMYVDHAGDLVVEWSAQGTDTVLSSISYTLGSNVERLTLLGNSAINATGNSLNNLLTGNSGANVLDGGLGDDTMVGGAGNDTYLVGSTSDVVSEAFTGGFDLVISSVSRTLGDNQEVLTMTGSGLNGYGNALANLIQGNSANNTLTGGDGSDILQGGLGADVLSDTSLKGNLFDGGAGADRLTGGAGNDMFIGGAGNDSITTGAGADIIAFNRGGGQDAVAVTSGSDNTVSLGKGILLSDLALSKSGNDLILKVGMGETISFKGWYSSTTAHSVGTLQVVTEGGADYVAGSPGIIHDNKVEQFNFTALTNKFDQVRVGQSSSFTWNMASSLETFSNGGSDTAAIGGDLAYQYGLNGNLAALSAQPALAIVGSSGFGTASQALQGASVLNDGFAVLY